MSDEDKKAEWTEKTYLILGIGGLCGLTKLQQPFDVFEVVVKLFGGSLLVGCTAIVLLQARSAVSSDSPAPGWGSIWIAIGVAYFITFVVLWQ